MTDLGRSLDPSQCPHRNVTTNVVPIDMTRYSV